MTHIIHAGYVSLFPLVLDLIPVDDEDKLGRIFDIIKDRDQLWSDYGICSLSKQDRFYGEGENYWRGPIWMNMNFMVLRSLHRHYIPAIRSPALRQRALKIYSELRNNLVSNMFSEYERTGYVWEQYSCEDGKGSRSHPFTGFSALVLLAMSEKY